MFGEIVDFVAEPKLSYFCGDWRRRGNSGRVGEDVDGDEINMDFTFSNIINSTRIDTDRSSEVFCISTTENSAMQR